MRSAGHRPEVRLLAQATSWESDAAATLHFRAIHIDKDRAGWVVGSRIFWSIEALTDRSAVVELRDRYEGLLRNEIHKAIAAGQLVDRDVGMMSRMILSWLNYIPRWHRLDGPKTSEEIAAEFLDMTLNGLTAG